MEECLMSTMGDVARRFVDACDTGQGWEGCKTYCHPDATFSAQADALAGIETVEAYTGWAQGLLTPLPDARYELRSLAVDEARSNVIAFAVFRGTNTAEGGPVPPTGQAVATDYVYCMEFENGRIRHMTKIWNDGVALRQLGWA
jgi:predicted ester cyclase